MEHGKKIHKSENGKETPIAELDNKHLCNILNRAWRVYQDMGVAVKEVSKEFMQYKFENGEHIISPVFNTKFVKDDKKFFDTIIDYAKEAEERDLIGNLTYQLAALVREMLPKNTIDYPFQALQLEAEQKEIVLHQKEKAEEITRKNLSELKNKVWQQKSKFPLLSYEEHSF